MIAYKAFKPGLICRGYQFIMGKNITDKANCRENGFHCAEDPLDCLSYYSNMDDAEYYIVDAAGDMDEDGDDTKISCTELTIMKKLTRLDFFLHGLLFMAVHPFREWSSHVHKDKQKARTGYAVVRGIDPVACGGLGDILAFVKEDAVSGAVIKVALGEIDGTQLLPNVWYDSDFNERQVTWF